MLRQSLERWSRLWRTSLRCRLVLILAAMLALLYALIVVLLIPWVARSERLAWDSRQQDAALNAARTVEGFLQRVYDYMDLVGSLDTTYLSSDPELMAGLLDGNEALLEAVRVDAGGRVLASASPNDTPVLAHLLTIPQSSWFVAASAGQSYAGPLQPSDPPYVILAAPAAGDGVVAVRVSASVLWQVVAGIELAKTGQAYVVDADGRLIAHPDPHLVLSGVSLAGRQDMYPADMAPGSVWSGRYRNLEGKKVLGTALPIGGCPWLLYTEVDLAEASAITRGAWIMALVVGVLGGALSWVIIRLWEHEIVDPVVKLRDGARHIRQGNISYRITSDREDEIGQLAISLNAMAAELQRREEVLEQARARALAASRFKSRLLANVSHDLRTPLNAILGFGDMLSTGGYGPLTTPQQRATERIMANTKRLISLIESLLDRAQFEAGRLELMNEPFEPRRLLDDVLATVSPLASEKGLIITTEIDPSLPPWIMGDRKRLYQLLMNLAENAVKFTDQGGVSVRLYCSRERWALEVVDTGVGIAPELQATVFDAFEQGDSTTIRSRKGVGLGLSIARDLATLMGGNIHLSSVVGEGSRFTVLLPLVAAPQAVRPGSSEPSAPAVPGIGVVER